ncbi:FAD-dependent oxidoreductase [Mesorhizobium sp.]|uniref:NAD(P)/FAD-dependent oxidoreductase n=1 Tax=Mesorhizobium sp. TaxID=1871066 RepID=UPI000FE5ED19|nr:FAD-dependent oxidoreductase [Mesorhizobium sp.]RWP67401.1 MAG: FAD-dependent oxidoreductase [Mesorhizobium sp.]
MPLPFSDPIWQKPPAAPAFRSLLPGGQCADVVIVGGGILGLSTALHAARFGLAVQVLEAGEIGQGASGLNGGQLIPGLKYDPEWLLEHFGLERGEILVNFAASTADAVFELIRDEKAAGILQEGQAVSDSRRMLVYYRKSADGRLVLGGRGRMALPTSESDWAHLERALLRLYPALSGVAIEKRWFGRVAMTSDHLPHIHEPEQGLMAVVGCQGRGVGLMTALGERIAGYLASGDARQLPFPVSQIRPIPFHVFRQVGVAATIAWYRMLDAFER